MGLGISGLWALLRLPASYNGLPFVVVENQRRRGRQIALHTYPFRDDPWPEDLGRSPRITSIRGFVLGDDCDRQIAALEKAVETPGPGRLVHPVLGTLSVTVLEFAASDHAEAGRLWSFEMTVVPYVPRVYPVVTANTQAQTKSLFGRIAAAVGQAFSGVVGVVSQGLTAINSVITTAAFYGNAAISLVGEATSLGDTVAALAGNFGRFAGGSVASNVATLPGPITTVWQAYAVVSAAAVQAQAIAANLDALATQPALNAATMTTQAQALTETVRAACADPADAIRLLSTLLTAVPPVVTEPSAVAAQASTALIYRRAALASIALACADYQPASSTEASTVIAQVGTLLDTEAVAAADAGQDASYLALRQLRQAVVADLRARSAALPALITVNSGNRPSLAMAYALYGDVTREPDMVARAHVNAPGFMPTTFEALAA